MCRELPGRDQLKTLLHFTAAASIPYDTVAPKRELSARRAETTITLGLQGRKQLLNTPWDCWSEAIRLDESVLQKGPTTIDVRHSHPLAIPKGPKVG